MSTIICNKENIILNKFDTNHFSLIFSLHNKNNLDIIKFITVKLFKLVASINKEIIESVEIINEVSDTEVDILYKFKRFGKELGFSDKYMFIKSRMIIEENDIFIKTVSIPYTNKIVGEAITNEYGYFKISNNQNNKEVTINYEFKMDIHEELPIYMENIFGIMMKKIFLNFKSFIENVDIHNINV